MADVYITIGGVSYGAGVASTSPHVIKDSLTITDIVDHTPNTCHFQTHGFIPTVGQEVIVRLDSALGAKVFGGLILTTQPTYMATLGHVGCDVGCIDYTWLLDRRIVNAEYTAMSASTIVTSLLSTFTSGVTTTHVASGLATVDVITFTNESVSNALTRLAKRIGGYWYVDYNKDLHFYLNEVGNSPAALTSSHPTLQRVNVSNDLSQIVTRAIVEGGGGVARADVAAGATFLPVDPALWYDAGGGEVRCGSQRIIYTGLAYGLQDVGAWVGFDPSTSLSNLYCVTWADTLGLFLVPIATTMLTSPNGVFWTSIAIPTASQWYGICWSTDLGIGVMVGVSAGSKLITAYSSDGVTWTDTINAAISGSYQFVCWNAAAGLFIATGVTSAATGFIDTSPDGFTWTRRYTTAAAAGGINCVAWSESLNLFLAVGGNGNFQTSADALSWSDHAQAGSFYSVDWSPESGVFLALGNTSIVRSTNGTSYSAVTNPVTSQTWSEIKWLDDLGVFVAWAEGITLAKNLAATTDGVTWATYATVSTLSSGAAGGHAVAYSSILKQIVVVGTSTGSFQMAVSSAGRTGSLSGIPTSGAGSIQYGIKKGDPVNIVATVNDTAAQAALALLIGGDGIQEGFLQDGRIGLTEATARATALIALSKSPRVSIDWVSRDRETVSGRTIAVNLPQLGLVGSYKIQQVTISGFHPRIDPMYTARASSSRYSLEDLLRQAGGM